MKKLYTLSLCAFQALLLQVCFGRFVKQHAKNVMLSVIKKAASRCSLATGFVTQICSKMEMA